MAWQHSEKLRVELRKWVRDSDNATSLARAGLTGNALDYKLGLFDHARDEYLDYGRAGDGNGKDESFWKPWIRRCKLALKAAGYVVGSLVGVAPFGEGLKELVDAVDTGLDLGEWVLDKLAAEQAA